MKSDPNRSLALWLSALLLPALPVTAQEDACEVAVAALSLPGGSGGLLHWRAPGTDTRPLQLSVRYFSERLKVKGGAIQLFDTAVAAGQTDPPPPEPLLSVGIPPGAKLLFLVLWSETDDANEERWRGRLFNGADWDRSSLKVLNASAEPLGLLAGEKRLQLPAGKSLDFRARDWDEPFPVKIFKLQPEMRPVFSSTWRVGEGRRELCFLIDRNGRVSLRSLVELAEPPPVEEP